MHILHFYDATKPRTHLPVSLGSSFWLKEIVWVKAVRLD